MFLGGHLDGEIYHGPVEQRIERIMPREPDWKGDSEPKIEKIADVYILRGIERKVANPIDQLKVYFYVENDLNQEEFFKKAVTHIRYGYILKQPE